MTEPKTQGRVTTFYSYKGGVGRSFLLANVAWTLARWGQRVLCLDWDLEAPGLHRYLDPHGAPTPGTLDLLQHLRDHPDGPPAPWQGWVRPLGGPWRSTGCLHLMTAGQGMGEYTRRLSGLHWDALIAGGLAARLEATRAAWVDSYDHVLIDSRTGITDVGGLCAAQLPDLLVLVFTASAQSLEGALDVAQKAQAARARLPLDRAGFDCLPVPCRVHVGEEDELERHWMRRFERETAPLIRPWLERGVGIDELLPHLRVREQAKWSFGEQLPVRDEPDTDPARVSWAIANVAALVSGGLEQAGRLLRDRRGLLAEQLRGDGPPESRRVILSALDVTHPAVVAIFAALRRFSVPVDLTTATAINTPALQELFARLESAHPTRYLDAIPPELLRKTDHCDLIVLGELRTIEQYIQLTNLSLQGPKRAVIVTLHPDAEQLIPPWLADAPRFAWSPDPAWSPAPVVDAVLQQLSAR
jgi:cellulose biosynthesis protein BcsQ